MIHEDSERVFVVLEVVFSRDLRHLVAGAVRGRSMEVGHLHEAEVVRLLPVQAVLLEHLFDDERGRVVDRQQQGLVRDLLAERLAVNLERAAGVRASVFAPELDQLLLELLLSPSSHDGLGVRNGPGEAGVGKFWKEAETLFNGFGPNIKPEYLSMDSLRKCFKWFIFKDLSNAREFIGQWSVLMLSA